MSGVREMSMVTAGIKAAMEDGRMLDAWQVAQESGVALAAWPHGEARRQAAALATHLGDARLGQALDWLNWRAERSHPTWYFRALFPRTAWHTPQEMMAEIDGRLKGDMPDESRAELLAYQAWSLSALRDFTPAHAKITRALELDPEDSWLHVQRSGLLEAQDRYAEALEAAEHARQLKPRYRSSVLQCADLLIHMGRDDEALALLLETHRGAQQAAFALRMQTIHSERENHAEALWCLDEAERLSPLAGESWKKWAAGRRADFLYMAGDIDGCLELCDRKGEGFQKIIAKTLREPGARERKRVKLDVPFTRQHRMTCAPATLATLAAYWGKKHDHLEIADAICHEGTPWHKERVWAEGHGFIAREFRLTPETLRGLIDRGLPFTLTTQWTTGAHMQACIGYDDRTGVILLRDPTERHFGEMILKGLIKDHPIDGPRGMTLVPVEEAARLDGLLLPDEAAYEATHHLLIALDGHDRWKVDAALTTLRAVAPGSMLALQGEARVAAYLQDWPRELAATEALLERAPDHGHLLLRKSYLLACLGRRGEQRALLEKAVPKGDAVFASELGELLLQDARELPLAAHFLKRALRRQRSSGRCHESLARCRDKQHRHAESIDLRRAAASLSPDFEGYSRAYFDTCRVLKRTAEGLEFLRERVRIHGRKDAGPWITLASCLDATRNDREAAAVLEEARAARPDDGELLLEAGGMMAGWGGEFRERGLAWIEAARGKVPEARWLRKSGQIAGFTGDRRLAILRWRGLLAIQPLSVDAWRGLVRLTAEEEGETAAMALLDSALAKHPGQTGLWALAAEWRRGRPEAALQALDQLLERDPRDRWAWRERALRRLDVGRKDEALADVHEAGALDPRDPLSLGILATVQREFGRNDEARTALMEALRIDIDYTWAARELMELASDRAASLETLHFINAEMRRQVSNGEIVPDYQELAWRFVAPPVLLGDLQEFCRERPDLWQTWSARVEQALRMRFDGEAMAAATTLTENFSLLPRAWLDLAKVHHAAGRHAEEEKAIAVAVDLSPGWDEAARQHAEVLERLGRLAEAEAVLRRALLLEPLTGANYGCLADFLRRTGRRDEGLALLIKAAENCPFYSWGWDAQARWAKADGREEEVIARLQEASLRHGHRRSWWPVALSVWDELGRSEESIAAIRRGLELSPGDQGLRDQLAYQLCEQGKHDEAMAACAAIAGEAAPPRELEGRRAWILMRAGRPVEAIAAMQSLLEREPDYGWGSSELAGWLNRRADWPRLRDLARTWSRHAPRSTIALGFLGQAERELANDTAAMEAYGRALALDPEYLFAGRQLADMQMARGEFDQAAATIALLRHYVGGSKVTGDAIELTLKRGDLSGAFKEAESLLTDPEAGSDLFGWIGNLFQRAGREVAWGNWLGEQLKNGPVAAPGALVAFLQHLPPKKQWTESVRWITREPLGSESRIQAWRWLIGHAGKHRRHDLLQAWGRKDHRAELHGHGALWNAMGSALLEASMGNDGAEWLGDWQRREKDLEGHTLVNLAALYEACTGDIDTLLRQAVEVRRAGLARFPASHNAPALRAGLALGCALDGRIPEAKEALEQFEPSLTNDYYRHSAQLAEAIVATAEGRDGEAAELARTSLGFFTRYPDDFAMKRLREKGERVLASHQPWTKGKVGKLRKRWNLPVPSKAKASSNENSGLTWFGGVAVVVLVNFLIRTCSGE
ncbi:tetratricopeptide repeat protein [Luteolibacter arcticus]|uniref:Tetratricopeptide repeat protein n=1 Tax=Luteolibacter arcticus TaxID=1581411 RepID=A0ABT3GJW7_9BACT|nr:tetratricopeptide repeat protein [Luteolibacter arcticus]MCW1923792.1 tetratricopeptide repeat protein [Luteolibacter arcticus]